MTSPIGNPRSPPSGRPTRIGPDNRPLTRHARPSPRRAFSCSKRGDMKIVLIWAWRYHSLYVDECDTLDEAISLAAGGAEAGSEALDCIEVWDDDGYRKLDASDVFDVIDARPSPITAPARPVVASIEIARPDGSAQMSHLGVYHTREEAEAEYARLRPILGDRVHLRIL